jgi:hypothetical protein
MSLSTCDASTTWQKSTMSIANGACVQVKRDDKMILLRDSKHPEGPVLTFTPVEWAAFLDGAKKGEFDRI